MRLRRYTFKASGTVKNIEQAVFIMKDSLNRGKDSIIQHKCPEGIIVQDKNIVHQLGFTVSANSDSISEVKIATHDWLPKHWKDGIRECLQIAADKTGEGISIDGNMKYVETDENLPEHFYHITEKEHLEAIMEEGLAPKRGHNDWKSKKRCAYLTEAEYIVPWLWILDNVDDPVILEIETAKLPFVEQGRIWEDRDYVPGHIYSEHRTTETIPADAVRPMSPYEVAALGVNEKAINQLLYVAGKKPDNYDPEKGEATRSGEEEVKLCVNRLKEMGVMDKQTYMDAMNDYDEKTESADFADFAEQVGKINQPEIQDQSLPFM